MSRRQQVVAGGRRLEYEWVGPPPSRAPALVFLHDGLGCVETWRDFPRLLAGSLGCGALVYSRAGYGGSEAVAAPLSPRFMHDEALVVLPELLAAAGVGEAVLVGHSDGASIALIFAAGPGAAGGRVRALIAEAPHSFVEPLCVQRIARMRAEYPPSALAERMARVHGANAGRCFARWAEVWLSPEFRDWNIEPLLPAVACPILVVQGKQDDFGTVAQVRAIETQAGGAVESVIVPGCGHTPHHQRRPAALAAMVEFLARALAR
ncbi:MAG TPA: alpha/beta hydrolase [Thermoanaerobaculia bacterium]|nr:alpha/beta hydrolase [Thermoanaerobaculia bacterium]